MCRKEIYFCSKDIISQRKTVLTSSHSIQGRKGNLLDNEKNKTVEMKSDKQLG